MSALITLPHLLKDEEYVTYFKRNTRVFEHAGENPWQVVALKNDGKWANGFRPTFKQAFLAVKKLHHTGEYQDFSIIARNRIFATPRVLADRLCDAASGEEWCGRCRRPTRFRYYGRSHHALRHAPVVVVGRTRCFFCGISYEFHQGTYGRSA